MAHFNISVHVVGFMKTMVLPVNNDMDLGMVVNQLITSLDFKIDWTDYALWLPRRKRWLTSKRAVLNDYEINPDDSLEFRSIHYNVVVQLTDMQEVTFSVSFIDNVFTVVRKICTEMNIVQPEFMSLMRIPERVEAQSKPGGRGGRRPLSQFLSPLRQTSNDSTHCNTHSMYSSRDFVNGSGGGGDSQRSSACYPPVSPNSSFQSPSFAASQCTLDRSSTLGRSFSAGNSPSMASLTLGRSDSVISGSMKGRTLYKSGSRRHIHQRAMLNSYWLDSSLSLMEQGVDPEPANPTKLQLRFKYPRYVDVGVACDMPRLNLLYSQARSAVLNEEVEFSDDEAILFAALQFQIFLQCTEVDSSHTLIESAHEDIDDILNQLQTVAEGPSTSASSAFVNDEPVLRDNAKFCHVKKYKLNKSKMRLMELRGTTLTVMKKSKLVDKKTSLELRGGEIRVENKSSPGRMMFRIFVTSTDAVDEYKLQFAAKEQYVQWLAACRLASDGRTMASRKAYNTEMERILQTTSAEAPAVPASQAQAENLQALLDPFEYLPLKFKRQSSLTLSRRILAAQSKIADVSVVECKRRFVEHWRSVPQFDAAYFPVRFLGGRRSELVSIGTDRLHRLDPTSGIRLSTWLYKDVKSWHTNWENQQLQMHTATETICFEPVGNTARIMHELIGGNVFMNIRMKMGAQQFDEALFFKLTGADY